MRKWFNISLALIVLGQTSSYILACSAKSTQDKVSPGWSNIDNNKFTKIAGLTLDNIGNIYFIINNINNNRSYVFKYDIVEEKIEPILSLSDTVILSITNNGNAIYQSINGEKFVKSNVETNWIINQIVIDDQNHLYAGGINNKLYAGVITTNTIDNFSIISSQTFNNIYSLNYEQGVLIVGGQVEFSLAQVDNFDFTKKVFNFLFFNK